MRSFLLAAVLTSGVAAQESAEQTDSLPEIELSDDQPFLTSCEHPVINKARTEGLASLSWKETPVFIAMSVRCKLQARQAKTQVPLRYLFNDKQANRHAEAKTISGPGSCCITITGLILLHSFLGAVLGASK